MLGVQLVQGGLPNSEQQAQRDRPEPFADLFEVLSATRAKLEELTNATALVVSDTEGRKKLEAIVQENERLAIELEQANGRRSELESSVELAQGRIAELAKTVDAARRDSARLNQDNTTLRQQNQELIQAEARLVEAEKTVESSRAEAEALKTELAAAKEQLEQAAGAVVAAERERQAATSKAEAFGNEAKWVREELIAARKERARFETANAVLEKRIASLHMGSRSATEAARNNLMVLGEKLNELNAALDLQRSEELAPTRGPQDKPADVEDERTAASQTPSTAQPPAAEPADKIDTEEPADSTTTASAPADVDSGLERFHADVRDLNRLELNAGGVDLFSDITSVDGREVHVTTTAAWETLPPLGQESYLDSLLDSWVAARGGEGPAVVRIVDPSGEVLGQRSWP